MPALIEAGVADSGLPYLVLERLRGRSLAAWLRDGAGRDELLEVLARLAATVDAVHAGGHVHRDLKPSNAWVRGDGSVCVFDFGLAIGEEAAPLTRTGQLVGTPIYMAPEQCMGAAVGAAADRYAFAVIAFEALVGRPPFVGDPAYLRHAHATLAPPRPGSLTLLPSAVDDALYLGLAKSPSLRPTATALVAAIRAALSRDEALGHAPTQLARRRPSRELAAVDADASTARPIGLLAARLTPEALARAVAIVQDTGGELARLAGARCTFAFCDVDDASAAAEVAHRAGARLLEEGLARPPIALHVVELAVRRTARGPLLPIDATDPGRWPLPREASASIETEAPEDASVGSGAAAFRCTPAAAARLPGWGAGAPVAPALAGRARLIVEMRAFAEDTPRAGAALATLVGAPGAGKSRTLEALAGELRAPLQVVHVVPPPHRAADWMARALLGLALGADACADAERFAAACGHPLWPAAALALGLIADDDPRLTALRATPTGLKHAVTAITAAALLRRAAEAPLALLVDDVHLADLAAVAALELATQRRDAAVVVFAAAPPGWLDDRPLWGDRAARAATFSLAPLDGGAARALWLELLRPLRALPAETLAILDDVAGRQPGPIVDVARALHRRGALRRQGAEGWVLGVESLAGASRGGLARRLAQELVDELPLSLARLARLAALLGDALDATELRAAARALAIEIADADAGLGRLVARGVLYEQAPGRFHFHSPRIARALPDTAPPGELAQLHAAALEALAAAPPHRRAPHAAGCGRRREAHALYLEVADRDRARHRVADAETAYSAALAQLAAADPARGAALAGRAQCRYRMERLDDALADLREARGFAEARADARATADLLLDEAIVLDWKVDLAGQLAAIAAAEPAVEQLADPRLHARLRLARGRTANHSGAFAEACDWLERARAGAAACGDAETYTIACVMLPPVLVNAGRLDEAAARFDEAARHCEATGDRLHLAAVFSNRVNLWAARRELDRAVGDARLAVELAREIGNTNLEKRSTYNLAECLFFAGRLDEAEPLARRTLELAGRVHERPGSPDTLLLARIAVARDDLATARTHLAWLRDHAPGDLHYSTLELLRRALELVCDAPPDAPAAWRELLADPLVAGLTVDEREELLRLASRTLPA